MGRSENTLRCCSLLQKKGVFAVATEYIKLSGGLLICHRIQAVSYLTHDVSFIVSGSHLAVSLLGLQMSDEVTGFM